VAEGIALLLYYTSEALYMDAPNGATMFHEEHQPITVPPGTYVVRIVREYDHFSEEARYVAD
jgi:hypothetical protein